MLPEPASRSIRGRDGGATIKAGPAEGIAGAWKDAGPSAAEKERLRRTYWLPPALSKGLEEAWEKSLLIGETGIRGREHGGILVRTWPAGTLAWRPVKPGRSDEIDIPAHLLAGETMVATGHTHPYSELEIIHEYTHGRATLPEGTIAGSYAGTMAVCKHLGLEFFQGEGDTLTRADPDKYRLPPEPR